MKKNILMVGLYPPKQIGGGEIQLQTLSRMLDKRGHNISVLSMGTKKHFELDRDKGIKIYRIGKFQESRRGAMKLLEVLKYITVEIFNPLFFIFTIYLILKNRIETVHIMTYNQISLSPIIAAKILMRNVVTTIHSHELLCPHSAITSFCYGLRKGKCGDCMSRYHKIPASLSRLKNVLLVFSNLFTTFTISLKLNLTNHLADTIVFPSDYLRRINVNHGVRREKTKTIPCFLEYSEPELEIVNKLRKKLKLNGKRVLLYVGKVIEEKGIKVLLESLKEVAKKQKNWVLVVVGQGGSFKKMKELSKELKISNYVKFAGLVPHSHIFSYYKISDFVIVPSIVPETFSIVLSEACLSKKIVICSKIGALEERVRDGENGLLVEPNDTEKLAKKISYVLKNVKKLRSLGETAYKDYKLKYKSGRSLAQYLKIFGSRRV